MSWTTGFVGAGVMAEVMIAGLLDEGVLPPDGIVVSDRRPPRSAALAEQYSMRIAADNTAVVSEVDLAVLAVKPQDLAGVLRELSGKVRPGCVVVSIVAGADLGTLQRGLQHPRVVRCMPNLPCRIRHGMTVWAAPEDLGDQDAERVAAVLGVMGQELRVSEESHVDRATAVNGTGPAIVAAFYKAMLEAAAYLGEPRDVARETVLATLLGTGEMIRRSDAHVAQLIDEVTSPGGTTSRALQVMKQGRFSAVLTDAVQAAYLRTTELGDALREQVDEIDED